MRVPRDRRPVFGLIPVGSGNDYARTLGMRFDLNMETMVLQLLGAAAQGLAEGRHHALDLAAAVDHLADVALFQGGGEDTEAERRGAEILALEHPKAGVPGHLQED